MRATTLFTILGDVRRVARTQILHGGIAYERGDIETALGSGFGSRS
jgi:hypothetical protein